MDRAVTTMILLGVLCGTLIALPPLCFATRRLSDAGSRVWLHLVECAGAMCLFSAFTATALLIAQAIETLWETLT